MFAAHLHQHLPAQRAAIARILTVEQPWEFVEVQHGVVEKAAKAAHKLLAVPASLANFSERR